MVEIPLLLYSDDFSLVAHFQLNLKRLTDFLFPLPCDIANKTRWFTERVTVDSLLPLYATFVAFTNISVINDAQETAYLLSYALVLLHTITHKPNVKQKIEYNVWMHGYEREFKGSVNSLMLTVSAWNISPYMDSKLIERYF